jgi:hypothetical protein
MLRKEVWNGKMEKIIESNGKNGKYRWIKCKCIGMEISFFGASTV